MLFLKTLYLVLALFKGKIGFSYAAFLSNVTIPAAWKAVMDVLLAKETAKNLLNAVGSFK